MMISVRVKNSVWLAPAVPVCAFVFRRHFLLDTPGYGRCLSKLLSLPHEHFWTM